MAARYEERKEKEKNKDEYTHSSSLFAFYIGPRSFLQIKKGDI